MVHLILGLEKICWGKSRFTSPLKNTFKQVKTVQRPSSTSAEARLELFWSKRKERERLRPATFPRPRHWHARNEDNVIIVIIVIIVIVVFLSWSSFFRQFQHYPFYQWQQHYIFVSLKSFQQKTLIAWFFEVSAFLLTQGPDPIDWYYSGDYKLQDKSKRRVREGRQTAPH